MPNQFAKKQIITAHAKYGEPIFCFNLKSTVLFLLKIVANIGSLRMDEPRKNSQQKFLLPCSATNTEPWKLMQTSRGLQEDGELDSLLQMSWW